EAAAVTKLLDLGAKPDPRNKQGLSPLVMAVARGCGAAAASLARAGADVGLVLSGGSTSLHISADMGLIEAVEAILETETGRKCAGVKDERGRLPAHLAAMGGHEDLVKMLLPYSGLGVGDEVEGEVMARGKVRLDFR
ncbi:unnamed protein product, partial [Discosporangium mesarthrocarpum]